MRETIVVKCGGNAGVSRAAVCADVARLRADGWAVVVVHGGSAEIDALADRLGVPSRRLVAPDGVSTRYTDTAMLDVVQLALAGAVKPRIVAELARLGVPAVGLTGLDAGVVGADRKAAVRAVVDGRRVMVRDNHSGRVTAVRADLLRDLLDRDIVPVLSPPALAGDARPVNVDADRMAAAVAAALPASVLILLTGAPGVLRDHRDGRSVIPVCELDGGPPPAGVAGGMAVKLIAGREAALAGVPRVIVSSGAVEQPVRAALGGAGTRLTLAGAVR